MESVSVLIKNMTMPKNCIECPMQFGGWCYVCPPDIDERVAETVEEAVKQGKPDWCPLVEIEGDDVDPGVHGHWIEELGDVISCRCSRCDHSYNLYEDDINGYPYCAWCGAKMDESEDNK